MDMTKKIIEATDTSSPLTKMDGLAERSLAALKWNYLGVAARIISQVVVQVMLARLLGPEALGIVAAAIIVVGIGGILVDMGLGSALVQKKDLSDEQIRFVFTSVMVAGTVATLTLFILAANVGQFFNNPRIVPIAQGMSIVFMLQALCIVPQAMLKRNLDFRTIQIAQIAAYLVGFLFVGVSLALLGAGEWSLVAAWISQSLLAFFIMYSKTRHPLKPLFRADAAHFKDFGFKVLLTNIANWVIENVDNLLVGRVFGASALGLYSVSYNLVRTPANHLVTSLQTVLFPMSARAQDNIPGLQRAYLTVISGVALAAFPIFCGVAIVSDTAVEALFGRQWAGAALILLPLSLAMTLHAAMAVAGPMLWGKGLPGTELKVQFWVALLFVGVLLVAARYSVAVMAWGVFAVYLLRAFWMTGAVMHHIRLPLVRLLAALRGGFIAAGLVVAVLLFIENVLSQAGIGAVFRLSTEIFAAGLTLGFSLLIIPQFVLSVELTWVIQKLADKAPVLSNSMLLRRINALCHDLPV